MNKLQIGIMFLCAVCLSSCSSLSKQDNILTTQKYKWYSDRIVQGNYTGKGVFHIYSSVSVSSSVLVSASMFSSTLTLK
mgnify:CR=1 FL=1